MSLSLQFYNLIHRFDAVGGYQYLADQHPSRFQLNIWYDRHLVRNGGAMGYADIDFYLDAFAKNGLSVTRQNNGRTEWDDVCVVGSGIGIVHHKCPWLEYDSRSNSVSIPDGDDYLHGPTHPSFLNNPGVIEITGKLQGMNGIYAGSVSLDQSDVGHNCDGTGRFVIYIPKAFIRKLNEETDMHQMTYHNIVTGKDFVRVFRLTETSLCNLDE